MIRNYSIASRMIFLVAFMAVFSLGVGIAFSMYMHMLEHESVQRFEGVMHQGYERSLRLGVESFASQLSKVYEEARANGKDAELAVRMAIRHTRYDETNYYFIYDMDGKTIALPPTPEIDGASRINLQDSRGNFIIQDMIKTAKKGGGFTRYWYPKPGEHSPSPKLAYVRTIKGTNLFVGTGISIDEIDKELKLMAVKFDEELERAQYTVGLGVSVVLVFFVMPLVVAILRSILLPLKKATANAKEVASGRIDMQIDVQGHDEISSLEHALNSMVGTLSDNIKEIEAKNEIAEIQAKDAEIATKEAQAARMQAERAKNEGMQAAANKLEVVVGHVSAVSEEISNRASGIRNGAVVQSERIAETATAMEEMNATVFEVARNSSRAAQVGIACQTKAQNGANIVHKTIESMELTQKNILRLKDNMGVLGQQAEDIGNILGVIADIADQTNLLALNAAIEAARAGESGRGFAVVADEVRKLAEKTMGATKEVGDSIRAIQQGARSNIAEVEKAAMDMDTVVELSNQSGEVLSEIVKGVEDSSNQIQSIATAAEEQSATSEEINRSLDEINSITSETTRGVSQTADYVDELMEQMSMLSNLIQELKAV